MGAAERGAQALGTWGVNSSQARHPLLPQESQRGAKTQSLAHAGVFNH